MEHLGHYLAANEVMDPAKQRLILLSIIGPRIYRLLRSLVAPSTPTDKSLTELSQLLENHFKAKPLVNVQRFRIAERVSQ